MACTINARRDDDIVLAALEPEVSLFILYAQVSAQSPCAAELLPSAFGIVPVIEEEDWIVAALERNLTELPGGQGGAVVIQNLHDVAGITHPLDPDLTSLLESRRDRGSYRSALPC